MKQIDEAELKKTWEAYLKNERREYLTAKFLNLPRTTIQHRLKICKKLFDSEKIEENNFQSETNNLVEYPFIPDSEPTYEELKLRSIEDFKRLEASKKASKLIKLKIKIDGPYGIMLMGDPHIDDSGTDWGALDKDIKIVKNTPAMFGANVGDITNNWIGRLARLYSNQNMSRSRAVKMTEGFLKEIPWLWIDPGNHDLWSGADDPVKWITRFTGILYKWQGSRLELISSNGRSIIVNSRHDHPGHSMYHPTHGPLKAAQFDACHDDIYSCGHTHSGGYMLFVHPNGKMSHLIRLSSYKIYDNFKDERGFRDHSLPSAVFVVNPNSEKQVTFFHSAQEGADYLTFLRKNY